MKEKAIRLSVLSVVLSLLLTACAPRNPVLGSVVSAHGNTDWHIDTAEEFLFGTDMAGLNTAANHCPDDWTRSHIHIGLNNTANYYYDAALIVGGQDTESTNGIDRSMLFFYAGHGSPSSWDTLGDSATQGNMRLGNHEEMGFTRYFWQCSCKTFAHGPHDCPAGALDYGCPGLFDGSADSWAMRNVYERWGPVLDPDVRMACGASTSAWCHDYTTNSIWDNYNNLGLGVADSFIFGMDWWGAVPLCITRGGSNVNATPLVQDAQFTNQPNESGNTWYHIQYLSDFDSTPIGFLMLEIPDLLPEYLELIPYPLPEPLLPLEFRPEEAWLLSKEEVKGRGSRVRVHTYSGAVYVRAGAKALGEGEQLSETSYIDRALRIVKEQGWTEELMTEPVGVQLMVASSPVESAGQEQTEQQKSVIVTFHRQIELDGVRVNVLGPGGTIHVQMNNDGSLLNAAKIWRTVAGVGEQAPVKRYEEALEEALGQLEKPAAYKLADWTWGYVEASGNVKQTESRLVFRFTFVPVDEEAMLDFPPQMIEVPGHRE